MFLISKLMASFYANPAILWVFLKRDDLFFVVLWFSLADLKERKGLPFKADSVFYVFFFLIPHSWDAWALFPMMVTIVNIR